MAIPMIYPVLPDPFATLQPKPQAYQWLRFGEIKPAGWIRRQMLRDLEEGFLGHLDELVPALIRDDDVYGRDRLTRNVRRKDLGVVAEDAAWQIQYLWWNSETQSNWWDGFVRTALLLDHPDALEKAKAYVDRILATQDAEGYMGIYAPDLRFNFRGENGELWAQATLFRMLLGYYEATGEARVLQAVERAVQVTMRTYPLGQSTPFGAESSYAGVSHGLMFTDTLERLNQLTRNHEYAQYATWLYREYCESGVNEDDIHFRRLSDPAYRFQGHGVHIYEHLRALIVAVYATGNPALEEALQSYLAKLDACLTPSGGPIGDEYVAGRTADPSETGYEYCSIHELLDSYTHLLQKSGDSVWGDRVEWLMFNAGQGARHPEAGAVAYLKTDNSTAMAGALHPDAPSSPKGQQTRYKYSPVHQDVAVCCVPNAGRITPYFVKALWMHSPAGLVATLYGPCEVRTTVHGVAMRIAEETRYPFDLDVTFTIEVERSLYCELAFRMPAWADDYAWTAPTPHSFMEENGLIKLVRTWQSGDQVTLRFQAGVRTHALQSGECSVSYGPLLFARPIRGQVQQGRLYPCEGFPANWFADLYYLPEAQDDAPFRISGGKEVPFRVQQSRFDPDRPWQSPAVSLAGTMIDPRTGQEAPVKLVPLGSTVLRQATFPSLRTSTGCPRVWSFSEKHL